MICAHCRREFKGTAVERCPSDGAPVCEPEDLARLGLRVGNYELVEILGLGGMGVVYRAIHLLLDKPVAIKILCSLYSRRRCHPEDILREARTASRVRHRHIVDVTDFGLTDDGDPYFVMELLEGETLARVLGRVRRLATVRAVRIVRQIASALGAAHALGIIHRDLKPENVYLVPAEPGSSQPVEIEDLREERDFVKVADFGLAKVIDMEPSSRTKEGIIAGTPVYMSPEHARCEVVDGRSDIYSLGCVFYQMVTGVLPFQGRSALDFLMAHVGQAPPPPQQRCSDVDDELAAIILRCLEKDPRHRYSSMEELRQELREYLIGQGREASWPAFKTLDPVPSVSELPTLEKNALELQAALTGPHPLVEAAGHSEEKKKEQGGEATTNSEATSSDVTPTATDATRRETPYSADEETLPPDNQSFGSDDATQPPLSSIAAGTAARPRSRGLLIAGVAVLVLTVGLAVTIHRVTRSRATPAPPSSLVRVELDGLPGKALTYIDGVLRAERPLVLPRGTTQHQLRVEAEGFEVEERLVNAAGDQRLVLKLRPRPTPSVSAVALKQVKQLSPPTSANPPRPRIVRSGSKPRPKVRQKKTTSGEGKSVAKPEHPAQPSTAKSGKNDPDWVIDPD